MLGAQIAVADVPAVRVDQDLEQVPGVAERLVERELAVAREAVAEGGALDRRRGEPDDALQQTAVADRDDARVVQRRHPLEGREHPVDRRERGQPRREHVQLDRPRVPAVAGREAQQHRALARAVGNLEPLGEGAADLLQLARGRGPGLFRAGSRAAPERRRPGVGRRGKLARAEPDQPGLDGRIGLGLEVLPHQRRVHAGELKRADTVARGHQRLDQADGRRRAHRLRRGEPAPPAGRGRVILARRRRRRELLERGRELARVADPLARPATRRYSAAWSSRKPSRKGPR